MSSVLERYEQKAFDLGKLEGRKRSPVVISDFCVPEWETVAGLINEHRRDWGRMIHGIRESGELLNGPGGIALLEGNTPPADIASVTGVTANTALWQSEAYTPIAGMFKAPINYDMEASGFVTSSAASQTVIHNPHIGPASANAVGTNLTASGAQTLGSTITTAVWSLDVQLTLRTAGSGTSSTAIGKFVFMYTTVANAGAPTTYLWRSTANATFDGSALNGLIWGVTPSATGVVMAAQQVRFVSY